MRLPKYIILFSGDCCVGKIFEKELSVSNFVS